MSKTNIIFRISKEEKAEFIKKCAEKSTTMTEALLKFIKYYNGHKPKVK